MRGANAFTVLLTAGTGVRGYKTPPDTAVDKIVRDAQQTMEVAAAKGFGELRERQMADHQRLFRRVSLRLGPVADVAAVSTDKRLSEVGNKLDPSLPVLHFQFGRYLLISSSRPGTQPANLQGIWNGSVTPPWNSNWTANINMQMNYWPAETCNLAECAEPLFDLIAELSIQGRHGLSTLARISTDARRRRILFFMANRGGQRPFDNLSVRIDREQFHGARWKARYDQCGLHNGHDARSRVVCKLHPYGRGS